MLARSTAGRAAHAGKAAAAASRARRASAAPQSGTSASFSPDAGLATGKVFPESEPVQFPLTKACVFTPNPWTRDRCSSPFIRDKALSALIRDELRTRLGHG